MTPKVNGSVHQCSGLSRRDLFRVGSLMLGGLTLADLFRAGRAQADANHAGRRATSVIQVMLGGGPSQLETLDPKPDADSTIRSGVGAIESSVPGIFVSELMPRLAQVMPHASILRGIAHESSDHLVGLHQIMTGYPTSRPVDLNERPSLGAATSRLRGSNDPAMPPYVVMAGPSAFDGLYSGPAYLGGSYRPFEVDPDASGRISVRNLEPAQGLSIGRIEDRRAVLRALDRFDRSRDATGSMLALDRFEAQAFDMIAGPAARRALDVSTEPPENLERYGKSRIGRACLLARRLTEAGSTFVTVTHGDWDHHARVEEKCRAQLPEVDAAVGSLIEDLADRRLLDSVLVVVCGEFGRTARINAAGGRDHWPGCMSALVAGGGLRGGQVVGSSDRIAEAPAGRALRPEDLLLTIYRVLGIDPLQAFPDAFGRPRPLLDRGEVIRELLT